MSINNVRSMSPATKLLEKRRLMYEEQEKYETSKDKFKKREEELKTQEADLISKDVDLQKQLIGFSKILQENQSKKKDKLLKIKTEENLIKAKQEELERKKAELESLRRQTQNISIKVKSMRTYEAYLEAVKERNPDEYSEIADIKSRYETLRNSDSQKKQKEIQSIYEKEKSEMNNFVNSTNIEIMSLNNQITNKQSEKEKMDEELNKKKGIQEEETAKELKKTSEIGLILMAIDNLYNKCVNSKNQSKFRRPNESGVLGNKNKSFKEKTEMALKRLDAISDDYEDFGEILKELRKKPTGV
ncbi:unnamed protein product [Moneuplotes crassus]|uniref:DUF4200 domain-containing protein n=1 Tax=Euplotes crassus TaxID=5936 RepID=A0AAD2CYF9_EUPCR|nr:unnamed protein product [Moneuplotes crassus]